MAGNVWQKLGGEVLDWSAGHIDAVARGAGREIPLAPARGSSDTHFPESVAVRPFETPPYLRQGRIVYREAPEEIGFYEYHGWAIDPADTVTTAVIGSLCSSRPFSLVKQYDGQNQEGYLMVGRLERLDEIDYGGGVRVEARISAELVNLRTGATEWTGDAAEDAKVDDRNVDSVVVAMNHAAPKCIDELVASLNQRYPAK